jgi:hypothetical protein
VQYQETPQKTRTFHLTLRHSAKALGERGCQAVFIKRRDFGEINDTVRQGAKFAEGSETEPIEH